MDWDKLRALTNDRDATVRFMGEVRPTTKLRSVQGVEETARYMIEVVGSYTAGMKKMYVDDSFAECVDVAYTEFVEFNGGHPAMVISTEPNEYLRFREGVLESKLEDLLPIMAAALRLEIEMYAEQDTKAALFRLRKALEAVWGHSLPCITMSDTYKPLDEGDAAKIARAISALASTAIQWVSVDTGEGDLRFRVRQLFESTPPLKPEPDLRTRVDHTGAPFTAVNDPPPKSCPLCEAGHVPTMGCKAAPETPNPEKKNELTNG